MGLGIKDGLVLEVTHILSLSHQDGLVLEIIHAETPPDEDGPIITLNGDNPEVIEQNSTWNDPGANALDVVDGAVSVSIFPDPASIDTSIIGSEIISYIASDSSGNETIITRELIIVEPVFDKGEKPPLLSSDFTINSYKLVNYESSNNTTKQVPFSSASKTASNIRKGEKLYAREDKDIREIKAGIKLKDRQPKIYKNKHRLTDATIDSKHTKVKLQEAFTKKDRKIIYHEIRGSLVYSEVIINQISNKLEELEYLKDTNTNRDLIKEQIKSLDIEISIEPQVEAIVNDIRNSAT